MLSLSRHQYLFINIKMSLHASEIYVCFYCISVVSKIFRLLLPDGRYL